MNKDRLIERLFGRSPGEDMSFRRSFITRVVCLMFSGLSFLLTLLFACLGLFRLVPADSIILSFLVLLSSSIGFLLSVKGRQRTASWLLVTMLFLTAVFGSFIGGLGAPAILIHALAVVLAGTLLGSNGLWITAAFSVLTVTALDILHIRGFLPPPRMDADFMINRLVIALGALTGLAGLFWFLMDQYNRTLNRTREYLGHLARQIEENRKIHREKEALQARMFQSRKMESIGRMVGEIARDMNNVLTAIQGNAELGLAQSQKGLSAETDLNAIKDAVRNASSFTRDLLAFCDRHVGHPVPTDIRTAVRNMDGAIRDLLGLGIRFAFSVHGNPRKALIGPGQAEQIVLNLCFNARDAMPDGGLLSIDLSSVEVGGADDISNWFETIPGRFVLLTFEDTGEGMTEDVLSRLFEPFFTTKPKGTGLGLSIVYGIVSRNGGMINVSSKPGQGTVFRIYLPEQSGE